VIGTRLGQQFAFIKEKKKQGKKIWMEKKITYFLPLVMLKI
jgi:hypothetical protein